MLAQSLFIAGASIGGLLGSIHLAYLALAVRYWFRIPLVGILVASACFVVGALARQG